VCGSAEDADAAGGVFDDGEEVQASPGQGTSLEEITREQRIRLAAQEVGPGGVLSLGRRGDAVSIENLPDRGGGDLDAKRGQFPVDAPVAPRGVSRARRRTRARIDRTVRGRPRRRGALAAA
jgi:hypothetical protein